MANTTIASVPIRILILSDRSITTLGLKTSLNGVPDIQIVAECSTIDGAISELDQAKPDLTLVDLQDSVERGRALAFISGSSKIGVVFLASPPTDTELVNVLRDLTIGICPYSVSPASLICTIRSVHSGYTCLDKTMSLRLSELLTQCDLARDSGNHGEQGMNALTERETEVLRLIATGMTNPQIAKRLIVSQATAKAHVRSILSKLGVPDRTTAAVEAMRRGLLAG